jgi:formiminoglutamase
LKSSIINMFDFNLIKDYLHPIEQQIIDGLQQLGPYHLGNAISHYSNESALPPNLDDISLAIIGVPEERNAINNLGTALGPNQIRKELYNLSSFDLPLKMIDLGDILPGATIGDTYIAVSHVTAILLKHNIIPIVIGGSSDIAYGMFCGYEKSEQKIKMVHIDSRVDVSFLSDEIVANAYLSKIFTHKPNFLSQFSILAYQTYLVDYNLLKVLDQLGFNYIRLGKFQEDIKEAEPFIRDANLVTLDMSAIRASEAPGTGNASPNGLYGNEICAMARYAGMSDKVNAFGIFETNPQLDLRGVTSQLAAQLIWYFIDGFNSRVADYPILSETDFVKYTVLFTADNEIMEFLKSKKSNRWWIKVPVNNRKSHQLIPCSYADYEKALQEEYPDKWLQAFN